MILPKPHMMVLVYLVPEGAKVNAISVINLRLDAKDISDFNLVYHGTDEEEKWLVDLGIFQGIPSTS